MENKNKEEDEFLERDKDNDGLIIPNCFGK